MMGLAYFKAEPLEYARISKGSKVIAEGTGIARLIIPSRNSVELINTAVTDQPFTVQDLTMDKQTVTLNGGIVYRVTDPSKTLEAYDFSVDPRTKDTLAEGTEQLADFLTRLVNSSALRTIQGTTLENALTMADALSKSITDELAEGQKPAGLGLEVKLLYVASIKPAPEIEKALGAQYRESLLQTADAAAFSRRAKAVEEERKIKENEVQSSIEIAKQREELIKLEGENSRKEAEARAAATKLELGAYEGLDAETLRAHALLKLGANAARIQNLTITPEVLTAIRGGA